jgi:pyruvate/2-oxoacid:ferredoxin oxidoreductase beta subunit
VPRLRQRHHPARRRAGHRDPTCGLDRDKTVIVSGIGCSSRAAGYLDFNSIHTTHGRAIAFATGIKLARPELEVIVLTGDGDCSAIGGNHLIHAARDATSASRSSCSTTASTA